MLIWGCYITSFVWKIGADHSLSFNTPIEIRFSARGRKPHLAESVRRYAWKAQSSINGTICEFQAAIKYFDGFVVTSMTSLDCSS